MALLLISKAELLFPVDQEQMKSQLLQLGCYKTVRTNGNIVLGANTLTKIKDCLCGGLETSAVL